MQAKTTLFDFVDIRQGYLEIVDVTPSNWGNKITVQLRYKYPPDERIFNIHFEGVRSYQWIVVKVDTPDDTPAQMLTHDLGESNFQRTARFATVLAEIIVSYKSMSIEAENN